MSAPYLLYSDVHLHAWDAFSTVGSDGLNSRLKILIHELLEAYKFAKSHGADHAFCAGDVFHQRGRISPSVLNPVVEMYRYVNHKWGSTMQTMVIPGNHDLETNEATDIGDMTRVLPVMKASLRDVTFNKLSDEEEDHSIVAMIPWQPTIQQLIDKLVMIKDSELDLSRTDVIIHAPLDGVLRGIPSHGLTPEILMRACPARRIFCGHYHHHVQFDNVYSVGALTHQTWSDVGTKAGYLLVYPDRVEHYETGAPRFVEVDASMDDTQIATLAKGNYVRVTVDDPTGEDVATIRNMLTDMGAMGVLVKAINDETMSTRRSSVGASIERIDESIVKYAKDRGGEELARVCADIFKTATRAAWTS